MSILYFGQNYELSLSIDLSKNNKNIINEIKQEFHKEHELNYGFASETESIQIVNLAVKALGNLETRSLPKVSKEKVKEPIGFRKTIFELGKTYNTPIYNRNKLVANQKITGPALIEQMDTTTIIFPNDSCAVDKWGNLIISMSD